MFKYTVGSWNEGEKYVQKREESLYFAWTTFVSETKGEEEEEWEKIGHGSDSKSILVEDGRFEEEEEEERELVYMTKYKVREMFGVGAKVRYKMSPKWLLKGLMTFKYLKNVFLTLTSGLWRSLAMPN